MSAEPLWVNDVARCINQIYRAAVAKEARDTAMICADRLGAAFPLDQQPEHIAEAVILLEQAVWDLASNVSAELEAGLRGPTPARAERRRAAAQLLLELLARL